MFVNKYFVVLFITLYDSIKSSNGQFPTPGPIIGKNQKFDLQHPFGNENNFLIKAKLNYETIEGSSNDLYIEESIFSDEGNRIVTLINHEANPIEIFREFETQRISLICYPLKHCYRDGDLRNYQFHSEHEMVTRIVKSALLMGPYRIISYFANETSNKISRWVDTGNGSTQYMEMTAMFSDKYNKELTGLKNALKVTFTEGQERNVTLYITQVEPFKKITTITKLNAGHTFQLTESIGSRKNLFIITTLDSVSTIKISDGKLNDRELAYDYKTSIKYTLSGSNECAIEFGDAPDTLSFVNPDYYGNESYFPRNPVTSYSNKFMVKAEYNKVIDNVNYDLVVTTYARPSPNESHLYHSDWFKDLSIEQKLYSKSATNEKSFQYDYIESRELSFAKSDWFFFGDFHEIVTLRDRCFKEWKEAIILNLNISCYDDPILSELHNEIGGNSAIKEGLRRLLMDKLGISILRINLIKFNLIHYHIMAKVEIFDSIFIDYLKKRGVSHKFYIKSTESGQIHTSTVDECLHLKASKVNLNDVITCKTSGDYLCLGIADGDSLPDEDKNGLDCMLFSNSDQHLSRLSGEAPLEVIEKSYLNLNGSEFSSLGFEFAVVDVKIEVGMRFDSPAKAKSSSTCVFFYIFSILITIVIFAKFAFDFKLFQR